MVRQGYIPSVLFSAALGGLVGAIRKTWMPVAFGMGTCAFMVLVYELAIRSAQQQIFDGEPVIF